MEPMEAAQAPEGRKRFTVQSQDPEHTMVRPIFKSSCSAAEPRAPALPGATSYAEYVVTQVSVSSASMPVSPPARVTAASLGSRAGAASGVLPPGSEASTVPPAASGDSDPSPMLKPGAKSNCIIVSARQKDPHQSLKELAKLCILADCTLILAWSPEEAGRYLETYKAYEQKPADLLKEKVDQDFLSIVRLPRCALPCSSARPGTPVLSFPTAVPCQGPLCHEFPTAVSWQHLNNVVTDCLTSVKSVNKTDTLSLLSTFGSLANIAQASKEDLSLCPGIGPQKAKRLFDTLHEPFLKIPK
ncbi:DNA excision repair protein ERCC-1 isoform X4 [Lepidochelys kempii]|uniref:DNA excision repair protein ERCC-1 isoform X4 n=1 Tax=Lepidochelys kempii TaxID=8472 RepID=UPI003C6F5644